MAKVNTVAKMIQIMSQVIIASVMLDRTSISVWAMLEFRQAFPVWAHRLLSGFAQGMFESLD